MGFRDSFGIRPLVYGFKETEQGMEYMLASESVALDLLGSKNSRCGAWRSCIYF